MTSIPDIAIVNNIEFDHPGFFKSEKDVQKSFYTFLKPTKKKILANLQNKGVKIVINSLIKDSQISKDQIIDFSKHLINFELKVPGDFNILNASAVHQLGHTLNIPKEIIQNSLQNYSGIGRRFEYLGEVGGAKVYSDYAHHPTAIKLIMEAARKKFPNSRILLIFQPHLFSRVKTLFKNYVKVIKDLPVDQIWMINIYNPREPDTVTISSKQIVDQVKRKDVKYIGDKNKVAKEVKKLIKFDDIIFFMGAGDINKTAREFVNYEK